MSSRREEERNEKIIRGLMKLPPNRKCINCNSLGPQYVCTNFWTFVCTTCGGIHREFTHRVKSVSMAKFTKEEVDALQRGGNQRAREIFLKDWDMQQMRLPYSSNADRIREFIRNVYVNKKYAGGRTSDKLSSNTESLKNHEENQRRASSYHSYSQSPPYDYQYEDRRYGKQFSMLARRPGSDRGHYEGKINRFIYSPSRLREQMYDDRFANESSGSRSSDFSVSSTGDPFRYDGQSPNSQDAEYCSPRLHQVRKILVEEAQPQILNRQSEANVQGNLDGITRPQRTASTGSFGYSKSFSLSHRSVDSGGLSDDVVERVRSTETHQAVQSAFTSSTQTSTSLHATKQDPFNLTFVGSPMTSSTSSIDLFADFSNQHSSVTPLDQKPSTAPFSENEGWATFDLPHHAGVASETYAMVPALVFPGVGASKGTENASTLMQNNSQCFSVQSSVAPAPFTPTDGQWHAGIHEDKSSADQKSSQLWNAFDDSTGNMSCTLFGSLPQNNNSQVTVSTSKLGDPHIGLKLPESTINDGLQKPALDGTATHFNLPPRDVNGSPFSLPVRPLMEGSTQAKKSINPFDLPYDSNLEANNSFLDMSSLEAALPNPQLPTDYIGGLAQPWFPQNSATAYIPSLPEGGLASMAGQAPSSQLLNLPSQGTVKSLGGNPFA
ncbi:probable ADP-ribosylation factor GTPase-activating protein AGD14 isoform X1 [Phoenix dactylifera]|uniref:Probable ADP-ribosylation factor GTPase-activating protein AGD14 isoform X1 n=1 Tax=Phoenix dactylifera TaxID=42345 RepID=A0A8B7CVC4_PHODC|nr:probable ADP-ribosylation factor GTPase-activating protein AGD14 isoform X1 [Phoenix dactylifera]